VAHAEPRSDSRTHCRSKIARKTCVLQFVFSAPPLPTLQRRWQHPKIVGATASISYATGGSSGLLARVLSVREPRTARTKPVQWRKPCNRTWDPDPACLTPPTPSYPNQCNGVICAMAHAHSCNVRPQHFCPSPPLRVLSVREPRTARTKPVQWRKPRKVRRRSHGVCEAEIRTSFLSRNSDAARGARRRKGQVPARACRTLASSAGAPH
jgi:hypothetical protein